jgi:hypothetical protein
MVAYGFHLLRFFALKMERKQTKGESQGFNPSVDRLV